MIRTGTGGAFENPSSTVVDGTTLLLLDILQDWTECSNQRICVGDHVKTAAGRQYVVVAWYKQPPVVSRLTRDTDKIDALLSLGLLVQDNNLCHDAKPQKFWCTFTVSISGNASQCYSNKAVTIISREKL